MDDELAKVEDDLTFLSKLKERGHDCGFYIELLQDYRKRLKEEYDGIQNDNT